ncbi:hypothetical protein MHI04_07220 [Lysinibacillus sp. FSL K6-1151]|uniref:hypothetical protein n=1 Tax=Lysinibacillus sp. FSL K6-1151 TaxID=2921465 RepID=UPI00315A7937
MLKVKLGEHEKIENELIIDGVPLTKDLGYISQNEKTHLWVGIYDYGLSQKITETFIDEIPKEIWKLELYYPLDFTEFINEIEVGRDYRNSENIEVNFKLYMDIERWKKPFSIEEFSKTMEETVFKYNDKKIKWVQEDEEFASNGCHISCLDFNKNETIKSVLERNLPLIKDIIERVEILLIEKTREGSVVSFFDFPEHVRVPCEQYLVYFVEFLKNIGIDATTEISHKTGKVLFSVTPESKETALEQIREALDIYLQLPNNFTNTNFMSIQMEPKEQQLIANIQHLNGQLMLANALAQTQNGIIQSQRITIEQQQRFVDSTILQQSLLINTKNDDSIDKEEILGGSISLINIEGKGFQINLPSIYRWLRDKIRNE